MVALSLFILGLLILHGKNVLSGSAQDNQVTALGNFTALVAVNNTLVVTLARHAHAASSWPCDSLLVSLDKVLSQLCNIIMAYHPPAPV